MTTTTYKVLFRTHGGNLESPHTYGSLRLRYKEGEWTKAPIGGILCYDCPDRAQAAAPLPEYEVWECEAEEEVPLPPARGLCDLSPSEAKAVWSATRVYGPRLPWPEGTVAFRRVRPVHCLPSTAVHKVYKVIGYDLDTEELISVVASRQCKVHYYEGQWTKAPVGGLLCYQTLKDAVDFIQSIIPPACIYECEAMLPVPLPPTRLYTPDNIPAVRAVWKGRFPRLKDLPPWPDGTVAFAMVKPIQQVARWLGRKLEMVYAQA